VHNERGFIPALGFGALTPLYDPALRWIMREDAFRGRLLDSADIRDGHRVLDVGCGTGTLAILAKQRAPGADVAGVDPDPRVLGLAREKAAAAGVALELAVGFADALPYADGAFDRVLSSLVFHHLDRRTKRRAAAEVWRVLRPGGTFRMVDFGPPQSLVLRPIAAVIRHLEETEDNVAGRLAGFLQEAGFSDARISGYHGTVFGSLAFYEARRAEPQATGQG